MEKINASLGHRFNLRSDGRPILGASARDISAEILAIDERVLIIPAHIWTPWFSLLGSRSGFDSLEECFEDIAPYIHAVETGLSADPPSATRVLHCNATRSCPIPTLILPRTWAGEANEFNCPISYDGIDQAIRGGDIVRTIEFFPEQGKYHHDGHRQCGISLSPSQTREQGGICPVCNKPLTLGVLYRAEELADREAENRVPFSYQIPLRQILSQIMNCGENSKKVCRYYFSLIDLLGPEFHILQSLPIQEISGTNAKAGRGHPGHARKPRPPYPRLRRRLRKNRPGFAPRAKRLTFLTE